MGSQLYGYTTDEHEFSIVVPKMYERDSDMVIYISAHGGGTVGESYSDTGWDYMVTDNGLTVLEGQDLRSGGTPGSHEGMAATLASFLSATGESFQYHENVNRDRSQSDYADDYTVSEAEWLMANHERLGLFAYDHES